MATYKMPIALADIQIPENYYSSFTRVFTPIVMDQLIESGYSGYLSEIIEFSGIGKYLRNGVTLREFLDWVYAQIIGSYRSEYAYKNAIAEKILLGRHSLNTSCMLKEFRVENSRADVVILNGTSNAYEIKSEYDSFGRLDKQISSYIKVFDFTNIITSGSQAKKLTFLPESIGILELTENYTIKNIRPAISMKDKVDQGTIFDSLRKNEYLSIVKKHFGEIPDVPNTQIFDECKTFFLKLSPIMAHDEMVKVLKKRGDKQLLKDLVSEIPRCLYAYIIDRKFNRSKAEKLNVLLSKTLEEILGVSK